MKIDPRLSLVVAVAENGVIGRDGGLPWRLPDELKHFRSLTLGKTVLMGRKTWDSLGKPLPDRENWVLSRDAHFRTEGVRVFGALSEALSAFQGPELMVIGGAGLYRETLPIAGRIELTEVAMTVDGDTFFPEFERSQWREIARSEHPADARHACAFSFVTLVRNGA